jgi:cytochrome c553
LYNLAHHNALLQRWSVFALEHSMIFSKLKQPLVAIALAVSAAVSWAATATAPGKIDLAAGQKIAGEVCAACHGADGNSTSPANPKLAGQHADYLVKQLHNFKAQPGAASAERQNAVMAGFAATLSEADISNVAAWFAAQKLKPSVARNKDAVELGQKIYRAGLAEKNIPACAGCHAPNGSGIPAQYPRLQGQYADYTEAQLVAMRQGGTRHNSVQMTTIATRLTDREIKAVADYIAGLR